MLCSGVSKMLNRGEGKNEVSEGAEEEVVRKQTW